MDGSWVGDAETPSCARLWRAASSTAVCPGEDAERPAEAGPRDGPQPPAPPARAPPAGLATGPRTGPARRRARSCPRFRHHTRPRGLPTRRPARLLPRVFPRCRPGLEDGAPRPPSLPRDRGLRFASERLAAWPRARASGAPGSVGARPRGCLTALPAPAPGLLYTVPRRSERSRRGAPGTTGAGFLGAAVSRALRRPAARRPRSLRGQHCGLALAATKRCCCGERIRVPNDSRVPPRSREPPGPTVAAPSREPRRAHWAGQGHVLLRG